MSFVVSADTSLHGWPLGLQVHDGQAGILELCAVLIGEPLEIRLQGKAP